MSYKIQIGKDFNVSFKRLSKRYRSLPTDYQYFLESLQENPLQGAELYPGIRKIRMPIASKGRGKSGSARIITANVVIVVEHEGRIALLTIYDKQDAATVDVKVIRQMAREMGFDV